MSRQTRHFVSPILSCFLLLLLNACATTPPVQEMSNARQTIQAAIEAGAEQYAQKNLQEAQRLLKQAGQHIDDKSYFMARDLAIEAKEQAMKARRLALQKKQRE